MSLPERLYVYPWESYTENNCNSYFLDGPVKTLIDPGHAHLLHHLEARMAQDGFTLEDVQLALSTHPHPDHCEGLLKLKELGALIAMHEEAQAFIKSFSAQWEHVTGRKMPEFPVDFFVKEGRLTLGSEVFQVLETPGHAPGSVCFYWEKEGVLFSGDVVFVQSVGRVDLPGGNAALLARSLEKLMGLDVRLLCPGHGPMLEGRGAVKENFYLIRQYFFGPQA
uniref:MBL fold metallo-hydrolase n=1 Tax=Desulfacinum infernum TaxID=35837 RepID=A0A832EIW1_9BACT